MVCAGAAVVYDLVGVIHQEGAQGKCKYFVLELDNVSSKWVCLDTKGAKNHVERDQVVKGRVVIAHFAKRVS